MVSYRVVGFVENPKFRQYIKRVGHEASTKMSAFMYADIRDKIVKKALKKPYKKDGTPTKAYQRRLANPNGPFVWHTKNGATNTPKYFIILAKSKMLEKDLNAQNNIVSMEKAPWSKEHNWFKKMEQGSAARQLSEKDLETYTWKYIRQNM